MIISSITVGNATSASVVPVNGANRSQMSSGKPSLHHTFKNDQSSPVNPSVKMVYDRSLLLKLHNNPACMKKPGCLSTVEAICDKVS